MHFQAVYLWVERIIGGISLESQATQLPEQAKVTVWESLFSKRRGKPYY